MLAIVDYGVGNLFSLQSSLRYLGYEAVVSGEPDVLARAGHLILPGVGAFGDAAKKLSDTGLDKATQTLGSRYSASVSGCSFCWSAALSMASIRVWA